MDKSSARFLGAGCAGSLELAIFHPVDTAAKRLMTSRAPLSVKNYREVIFHERVQGSMSVLQRAKSLFPGFAYGALYKISQRMYKFGGQPYVKVAVARQWSNIGFSPKRSPTKILLCDGLAGALMGIGEVALLPFDVLKIRSQTNPTCQNMSMLTCFRQEGIRNLYVGWQWTLARNALGSFALFGINGLVKEIVFKLENQKSASFLQTTASSTAGSLASIVVACPFDVVKTRLQSGKFGDASGVKMAINILNEEGPGAFWKGVIPKCGVVGPKLIFSFTIAQYLMGVFEKPC